MKYMDDNDKEDFSYEDAWQLAKKLTLVAKPKSVSQSRKDFANGQI